MATHVELDISELKEFVEKLQDVAKGDFKKDLETWLEAIGEEFLRIVQDEIIRREVVDSRNLLASFEKGASGNVWSMSDGGLTLEVGSSVNYAGYVEDGHAQRPGRFIPGVWNGDKFIYQPGAKGGMVLQQSWVEGKHYFASAIRILDSMFPKLVEEKLEEWFATYLNF